MRETSQRFTEAVKSLENQITDSQDTTRKLAKAFEQTTREISQQNIDAMKEIVSKFIGNKVLDAAKWLVGTAIMAGAGFIWYQVILKNWTHPS